MAFRTYSKMPEPVSRLFFGGARVDDIIRHTKDLMKIIYINQSLIDDYQELEEHFNPIKTVRNNIIHWVLQFLEGGIRMSNIGVVKRMENMSTMIVSLDDLQNMRDDLMKIWIRLTYRHIISRPDLDTSEPWRYIPPSPSSTNSHRRQRRTQ